MAVSTVSPPSPDLKGEWRDKAVSRAQWWKIAQLALQTAQVDVPTDRGAASDLISQLEASQEAERAKDDCPFEAAA